MAVGYFYFETINESSSSVIERITQEVKSATKGTF